MTSLETTSKLLIVRQIPLMPIPDDVDSTFWIGVRGGVTALADRCFWLAGERLRSLIASHLLPLATRAAGGTDAPGGALPPQVSVALRRWTPAPDAPLDLWRAYQAVIEDYQSLAQQLQVVPSSREDLKPSALAALDVGLRQENDDFSAVITWQTLSIVLPAYNEEVVIAQTVQDCLRAVRRFCPNTEVIVVDDGSRDRTGAIADELASRDARVVAVHNRPNRGYGGALLAGFAAARGELLFFMDSDGQFDINQIQDLLRISTEQPGTVVLGYRAHRRDPFFRRLNAAAWKRLVRVMLGLKGIRDIDCAFKLFPTRIIRACQVQAEGAMVNTEFLVKMQRMRVPMVQVPVQHFARTHGSATGANLRVILKAFRELLSLRLRLHEWQPPAE